jgi:hypothetical protein
MFSAASVMALAFAATALSAFASARKTELGHVAGEA